MASGMGSPAAGGDSPFSMGMEHPADTLGVPPLVDDLLLAQFSRAVQRYAAGAGCQSEAEAALVALRNRLENLRALARLCRLAVLGHPRSVDRLRDELHCIAADYPDEAFAPPGGEAIEDETAAVRVRLAAAVDMFAGATFVSKDDPERLEWLIRGLVRAIEAAVCFPLAFARDAASYLGEDGDALAPVHAAAVIAFATARLIEGDLRCHPPVPPAIRARLERLAQRWLAANPVTEMFRALTGPRLDDIVVAIDPDDVRVGDRVTLGLRADCADQPAAARRAGGAPPDVAFVLFCPAQPATIVGGGADSIDVEVPDGARTGPVALVRTPDLTDLGDLVARYACEFPIDWGDSLFELIPMWKWAYPAAFGAPTVEVAALPTRATVKAFTHAGPLTADRTVTVGEPVYIHYVVDPPGSEAAAPLQVSASLGEFSYPGGRGLVVYTPSQSGDDAVVLAWGQLTSSVSVRIAPATGGV